MYMLSCYHDSCVLSQLGSSKVLSLRILPSMVVYACRMCQDGISMLGGSSFPVFFLVSLEQDKSMSIFLTVLNTFS